MWYDITATKMIQKYLNSYSQINMQFDDDGKVKTIALFQNNTWVQSPTLAKRMRLRHIQLPVKQKASITLRR
jgi:hypothetical protein